MRIYIHYENIFIIVITIIIREDLTKMLMFSFERGGGGNLGHCHHLADRNDDMISCSSLQVQRRRPPGGRMGFKVSIVYIILYVIVYIVPCERGGG